MRAEGGVVRTVVPAPRALAALDAIWTGGRWTPAEQLGVGLHRGGRLLRWLDVRGIDQPRGHRGALLLIARAEATEIRPGDVLTLGSSAASEYAVQGIAERDLPAVAVLGTDRLASLLDKIEDGSTRAVVFHEAGAAVPTAMQQNATINGRDVPLLMRPLYEARSVATEVVLDGPSVSLARLVGTLTPLRNFTLGTGEEMFQGKARHKKGRYGRDVLSAFEPSVSAQPGSVRVVLHEAAPVQLQLHGVKPSEPFELLAALFLAVAARDEDRLFGELAWHHLFSLDRFIGQIKALAAQGAEVRTSDGRRIRLEVDAVRWLSGMLQLPLRVEQAGGDLFGADFRRNWCRVLAESQGKRQQWTLYFDIDRAPAVQALLNRRVTVSFETRSPKSAYGGSGRLLSIGAAD